MRTGKENLNFCPFLHVADKSLRNLSAIFGILQEFMCGKRGKSAKNIIFKERDVRKTYSFCRLHVSCYPDTYILAKQSYFGTI